VCCFTLSCFRASRGRSLQTNPNACDGRVLHQVTVVTACASETDKKMSKPPFTKFNELRAAGVTTVWGEAAAAGAATGGAVFDVVVDNNGKDMKSVKPVIDWAKVPVCFGITQWLCTRRLCMLREDRGGPGWWGSRWVRRSSCL
jgi:hypothetical protein